MRRVGGDRGWRVEFRGGRVRRPRREGLRGGDAPQLARLVDGDQARVVARAALQGTGVVFNDV